MQWTHDQCYAALVSRDPRFDGAFYTGVTSTNIYCRTICPAPKPLQKNVEFYPSAAACEDAGFRPCLRCRPDVLDAHNPLQHASTQLSHALHFIEMHYANACAVSDLGTALSLSERQLQRLFEEHLRVSPAAYIRTRRLHLARKLLRESSMPVTTAAFASGFASIRTFNATFKQHYHMTPQTFRQQYGDSNEQLCLSYQAPFDWPALVGFLAFRVIEGLESVSFEQADKPETAVYQRLLRMTETDGSQTVGVVSIRHDAKKQQLLVNLSEPLYPHAATIIRQVRNVFDLDAKPEAMQTCFANDPQLAPLMDKYAGIRVPGCWDRFELFVRAILGQFVSVTAARRFCIRVVEQFGEAVNDNVSGSPALTHLFPTPDVLATADLSHIGTTQKRMQYIQNLAQALVDERFSLDALQGDEHGIKALLTLHGVGPWTGHYIAMRALKNPDAFPAGDLVLRKAVAVLNTGDDAELPSQKDLEQQSKAWQPWRAYAALALWRYWNEFDVARKQENKP